jgi:rfaE bifunctional protein kinase chain/domain
MTTIESVRSFAGKRVVVIGDLMLDVYLSGDVRRISPEAPVPVLDLGESSAHPGGAANAALNIVALGGEPSLFGVVGEDDEGTRLLALLRQAGVDTGAIVRDGARPTTSKTRVVARSQQIVRLDRETTTPLSPVVEARLAESLGPALAAADACVLSDYAKGVVTATLGAEVIRRARAQGRPIVVDPKGRDFSRYCGATVVTPNSAELERATGREVEPEAALVEAGRELQRRLEGAALLVTRGAAGMTLLEGDRPPRHLPTVAKRVYDVTGAGDTVVAVLAVGLAAGLPLDDAMQIANLAAGIAVGRRGTAAVSAHDLLAALEGR